MNHMIQSYFDDLISQKNLILILILEFFVISILILPYVFYYSIISLTKIKLYLKL